MIAAAGWTLLGIGLAQLPIWIIIYNLQNKSGSWVEVSNIYILIYKLSNLFNFQYIFRHSKIISNLLKNGDLKTLKIEKVGKSLKSKLKKKETLWVIQKLNTYCVHLMELIEKINKLINHNVELQNEM